MTSRYKVARLGALLLAAATALLVAAPSAYAATSGEYVGGVESGDSLRINGHETTTSLLGLKLEDGTVLKTYCVELDVRARLGARLTESPWSAYPDKLEVFAAKPDMVLWILHNSYPGVAVDELSDTVGVNLSVKEAIAGTQAAIWHFSNDATLDDDNPEDAKALYDYLTGDANTGLKEQPPVSLSLTPEMISDVEAGKNAGPFTVSTTAESVELTVEGPDGVAIVDAGGSPMDKDLTGVTQFWLSPPADGRAGEATVHAAAEATVEKGRLFVGDDNENNPTQTLIVAASTKTKAQAEAKAGWIAVPPTTTPTTTETTTETTTPTTSETTAPPTTTTMPPPSSNLPVTGASVLPVLGIGLLLIAAGVGALLLQRRLRRSDG